MRNFDVIVTSILALLPDPAPAEVADELAILRAELRIINRTAAYAPPEGTSDTALWDRLGTTLYRYLPKPGAYPWAQAISDLVTALTGPVVTV